MVDLENNLLVFSFDSDNKKIIWRQKAYNQTRKQYLYKIWVYKLNPQYIFCNENMRKINRLHPGQVKVCMLNEYYDAETIEFTSDDTLIVTVYLPTNKFTALAVHYNLGYFKNKGKPWKVPIYIHRLYDTLELEARNKLTTRSQ
ncbi:hypothetical protein [Chrysodeixis includens nucleopolyhedrovirus]|uniref:Uncharacterized protein n=1 Tax=Chrysodeixis includens nucleopolyhedrovirus TaxID=1207438 RepID=A0A5B8YTR9_9ABAC|nr:hypothetical protein QKU06_gp100 [Chrysodeixis includens nucleopolyhedrovirus]QED40628.1 hypothetical protein [Chrysodeixis includens nucleopolyhedrovirus]